MSYLSGTQLAILRQPFQATDLYLAVYQPPVVEHGRVFPDAQIQGLPSDLADNYYIAGFTATNYFTSGTVKPGMTLVFGSAPGLEDLGRTFVRGKSGAHYDFSVLENSPLVSGVYYRVYDFHEIWPVFPRVTVDSNNVITYYKNYDKVYTNQNTIFTPVPVVGPNTAARLGINGQKQMLFIATGSYTIDGTAISNVYWEINTNPVTILTGSTVSFTFTQCGHYTVETRVVNANAVTGTAYRHYILLNREENPGGCMPIRDWKFENLDGDWSAGGYQLKVSVGDESDDIRDGALVIVFAEDIYGTQQVSFGGYPDREQIVFAGYVDKIDNKNFWDTSRATIQAKSAINLLQNRDMFSVSLETSSNPVDWTQIKDMTINRIIDHYLRWHSTFLEVCDYIPVPQASASYGEQYEDIPRGEIFSNVRNILQNRLLANFVSDRQGRVFSEVNLNYTITGSRPSTTLVFENKDWIGQLKSVEDLEARTSSILLGGVAYDSALNTGTAYLSRAPDALFPLHFGKAETKSGMTINSQDTLNTLSGLLLADINSRFPSIGMQMANNQRSIDIIPQEFYQLPTDYPFTDEDLRNLRTIWANRRMIPRRINYSYKNFTLEQEVIFDTETWGPQGETVRIPAQPPGNGEPVAPEIPGINPIPDPPGIGDVVWEVTSVTGTVYDLALFGDYIYLVGDASESGATSMRVEKRRQSDGGLEWGYFVPKPLGGNAQGRGIVVDGDGIFICGAQVAPLGLLAYTIKEISETPGVTWSTVVDRPVDVEDSSVAVDIEKIGSYVFVVGTYPGSSPGRFTKLLASDGSTDDFEDTGTIAFDAGIVGDTELYVIGSGDVSNWTTTLSSHWDKVLASEQGRSIRIDEGFVYTLQGNVLTDVIRMIKRQKSDGTLMWESTKTDDPYSTIGNPQFAIGNSYLHFPFVTDAGGKLYQVAISDGSSFTGYSLSAVGDPRCVELDGNSLYVAGKAGGLWYISKRTLPYT